MWIIQLWLLEICNGPGPGAGCSAQMSLSKVNVVLVSSSVSAHGERKEVQEQRPWAGCGYVSTESEQDVDHTAAYCGGCCRWILYHRCKNMYLCICFIWCVQVWDDELERSATHWAGQCQWDHGPKDLLMSIGQNLAVHWGRWDVTHRHTQSRLSFQFQSKGTFTISVQQFVAHWSISANFHGTHSFEVTAWFHLTHRNFHQQVISLTSVLITGSIFSIVSVARRYCFL